MLSSLRPSNWIAETLGRAPGVFAAAVIGIFLLVVHCSPLTGSFFYRACFAQSAQALSSAGAVDGRAGVLAPFAARSPRRLELRRGRFVCHVSRSGKTGPAVAVVGLRQVNPTAGEPLCPRVSAEKEPR